MVLEFRCLDCGKMFTCMDNGKCLKINFAVKECLCQSCYSKNFNLHELPMGCIRTIRPSSVPELDKVC